MTNKEAIAYLERADTTVYAESKTRTAEALEMAIETLQERKTGKWIRRHSKTWECSECERRSKWQCDYCPRCGAKMEVDE